MTRFLLGIAFFVSILLLPWWVGIVIAILFLSEGGTVFVVVAGGFIFDELYGAPIAALHGFAYLYTALMIVLAGLAFVLRKTVL